MKRPGCVFEIEEEIERIGIKEMNDVIEEVVLS